MAKSKTATQRPRAAARQVTKPAKRAKTALALVLAAQKAAYRTTDPKAAFEHFEARAKAVPLAGLQPFNGQPLVMKANVDRAVVLVGPHLARAAERLADPPLVDVFELPALVLALDYATRRVPVVSLSKGEIAAMLREGAPWRELMLKYLEVASDPLLNKLPEERVAAVRKGTGKLDTAGDFVAIPGLFAEYADALEGQHPFEQAVIDRLGQLGAALLQQMQPGNAVVAAAPRSAEALLRDQFARLVEDAYDELLTVASVALGKREADALLPSLRTHAGFVAAADEAAPKPASPTDGAHA